MVYWRFAVFTFLLFGVLEDKTVLSFETEALNHLDRLLNIIVERLMVKGLNSNLLFHHQSIGCLKYSRSLVEKYTPEAYKQALKVGRKEGPNSTSARILAEVGLYGVLVGNSSQHMIDVIDLILKANEVETCKESSTSLNELLRLEGDATKHHWLFLLAHLINEKCQKSKI